jgi:hypothetical protein
MTTCSRCESLLRLNDEKDVLIRVQRELLRKQLKEKDNHV